MDEAVARTVWRRMRGAAALDVEVYEEVEHDPGATAQAAAVVAMTAAAQAVGASGGGAAPIVGSAVSALIGWLAWAGITFVIGSRVFQGTATWGQILRTLGFAQSPNLLAVFAILPLVGWVIEAVLVFWVLVAGIVAIRQALDFGTGRAILTALLGGVVFQALQLVF